MTIQTVDGNVIAVADGPNGPGTRLQIQKSALNTYGSAVERIVDVWGDGDPIWKNGHFIPNAAVFLITGDNNYVYVDVTGTTFVTGDNVWASRVPAVTVKNSIGQTTGFSWGVENILHDTNIPNIVWTNNSGD
jgi:hypothetical protein